MSLEFAEGERAAGETFVRLAKSVDEFEGYAHPHAARIARIAAAPVIPAAEPKHHATCPMIVSLRCSPVAVIR